MPIPNPGFQSSHIFPLALVPLTWTLKKQNKHKKLPRPAAGPKKDEMQSCLNQAAQPKRSNPAQTLRSLGTNTYHGVPLGVSWLFIMQQ